MNAHRTPRLFVDHSLDADRVPLDERAAHYLGRVLRLKRGDRVLAFNGRGTERHAGIDMLSKRGGLLNMLDATAPLPESALDLVLLQALLKSEPMDIVIQKAAELGVRTIIPVQTEHSVTRLEGERAQRRLEHWNFKARGACEQSGRHRPPQILTPRPLSDAVAGIAPSCLKLLLHMEGGGPALPDSVDRGVCLAAGPEGGFSPAELTLFARQGFTAVQLGPRILRAETASVAGCTFAQLRWGDLG